MTKTTAPAIKAKARIIPKATPALAPPDIPESGVEVAEAEAEAVGIVVAEI